MQAPRRRPFELTRVHVRWGLGTVVVHALTASGGAPPVCFVYRTTTLASSSVQRCTFRERVPYHPILRGLDSLFVLFLDQQPLRSIFSLYPIYALTTRHDYQQRCRRSVNCIQCSPLLPTATGKHAHSENFHVA
jgi:hypothetical protein